MRVFAVAIIAACAVAGSLAQAQQAPSSAIQACAEQGRQQKLAGQALADFLTKCANTQTAMPAGDLTPRCQAEARRHALAGEELSSFMSRCTAGQVALSPTAASAPPTCEERARVRDLSGEGLSNFMRRCQAGQP